MKYLLESGLDINEKDINSWTPLHYAVEKGRKDAILFLLKKGADINARTYMGESPYNIAQIYKYKSGNPIDLLIQNGADKSPAKFNKLSGKYMGQNKPGSDPKIFLPGIMAGHYTHHSTPVFSPDGNEAYWSIQVAPRIKGYGSSFVMYSKIKNGYWTKPVRAPFNIEHRADVPFFHPGGKKLYHISRGPLKKQDPSS